MEIFELRRILSFGIFSDAMGSSDILTKAWFMLLLSSAWLILTGTCGMWWELSGMWSLEGLDQLLGAARSFSWEEQWEELTVTPENLKLTLSVFVRVFLLFF